MMLLPKKKQKKLTICTSMVPTRNNCRNWGDCQNSKTLSSLPHPKAMDNLPSSSSAKARIPLDCRSGNPKLLLLVLRLGLGLHTAPGIGGCIYHLLTAAYATTTPYPPPLHQHSAAAAAAAVAATEVEFHRAGSSYLVLLASHVRILYKY